MRKLLVLLLGLLMVCLISLPSYAQQFAIVPEIKVIIKGQGAEEVNLSIINLTEHRHLITVERYGPIEKLISFSSNEIRPSSRLDLDYEEKPTLIISIGPRKKASWGTAMSYVFPLPFKNLISIKTDLSAEIKYQCLRDEEVVFWEKKKLRAGEEFLFGQKFQNLELVDKRITILLKENRI